MTELTEPAFFAAKAVMVDDWIEIAGQTYRVKEIATEGDFVTLSMYMPEIPNFDLLELKTKKHVAIAVRNQK